MTNNKKNDVESNEEKQEADDNVNDETTAEENDENAQAEDTDQHSDGEIAEDPEDEDLKTQYLRLAADFQNYKRRTEQEKSSIYAYANEKIASDLLNVMDNFERAMAHVDDSSDKNMGEGMRLVYEQLKGVFERSKIEEIPSEGEVFDPNVHHAVMTEKIEGVAPETVTIVLQKGYTLNGKVIRAAMVKVAE